MILSFKQQFVEPILNGSKIHTIREDKPNRWRKYNSIHFATGVRTKNYNCFKKGICRSYQDIEIVHDKNVCKQLNRSVFVDGIELTPIQILKLAKNDGFKSEEDFFEWFNTDFEGKIIHWTNLQY